MEVNGHETTPAQEKAIEWVERNLGRAAVQPSPLHHATRNIIITGIIGEDVETTRWTITPDGAVANVYWRDSYISEYLRTIPDQRTPLLVGEGASER